MPTMPIKRNGKVIGYRWGDSGKVYLVSIHGIKKAEALANKQGVAIVINRSNSKVKRWRIRRDGVRQRYRFRNYGAAPRILYHGTSEEHLANMPLSEGLKPSKGKLYLSDDYNYARFKARQVVEGKDFKPVIISVKEPSDLTRKGRHFITSKTIPVRDFVKVDITNKQKRGEYDEGLLD